MKIFIILTAVIVPMSVLLAVLWALFRRELGMWEEGGSGMWHLELLNMTTGERLCKDFSERLEMGRRTQSREPEDMLFLGTAGTISRIQCRLIETEDGIWIENASTTNISRLNGIPLETPRELFQKDVLQLGEARYLVSVLEQW